VTWRPQHTLIDPAEAVAAPSGSGIAIAERRALRTAADRSRISEKLVSLLAPESYAADQYRALRQIIERRRRENGYHIIGVTSPCPGDGKTVTALNLAGTLAQADGSRVLVIDGDLRRPSVAGCLGLERPWSPGLAEAILDGGCELAGVVRTLDAFNLSVVPAGAAQTAPYELLNSPRFEALLREARRQYDCVLIDTPPAVPFADCRLIERFIDAFLLVIAAHRTPRKLVSEALNLIDPGKIAGAVFNGDDQARPRDYGYYEYYGRRRRESW